MDYFAGATSINPNNSFENYQKDAFVRMADCQMMLKQYNQALQSYQQVIDLVWNYVDYATLQKAIILGGMGKTNEKVNILKDFENLFPNSVYTNDARIELADTYINHENFQDAIAPLSKIILDRNASAFYPQAHYKLGIVYFNLNKNVMALQTFRDLFAGYPTANETDNAVEFVRNIFIEDQTPELFVQFMNDFGKSLSTNEQDSLVYRAAIIKYEQRMYPEAAIGFTKYLQSFPNGKYQLDANYLIAEIAYSKEQYDTAAKYFGIVANQSPNKFAERAALFAARLNYFTILNVDLAEKYFNILLKTATQQENKMEAYKGLLRCQYKAEKWQEASVIAQQILADKSAATDDIQMANMSLYHFNVINKDTTAAYQVLSKIIKSNPSNITADAHYQLASLYLAQNKLILAEKTAFEVIKKQSAYDFWVTKAYILLGDIYAAQKDNFNAIATYKSVAENAADQSLKQIAQEKLKAITESTNNIK
jgi:TolA-binding protein